MYPRRFVRVPWGAIEQADLEPAGMPDAHIHCGSSVEIIGMHIASETQMLGIKLIKGQPISAALTTAIVVNTDDPWQSNPRRTKKGEGD